MLSSSVVSLKRSSARRDASLAPHGTSTITLCHRNWTGPVFKELCGYYLALPRPSQTPKLPRIAPHLLLIYSSPTTPRTTSPQLMVNLGSNKPPTPATWESKGHHWGSGGFDIYQAYGRLGESVTTLLVCKTCLRHGCESGENVEGTVLNCSCDNVSSDTFAC